MTMTVATGGLLCSNETKQVAKNNLCVRMCLLAMDNVN